MDTVTFNLEGGPTEISVPDTVLSCLSDGVTLSVTNLDANDTLSYSWSPANLFVPETVNSANPVFNGPAGDYEVSVTATNQYGCATTETSRLIVIDDNASLSFTSEVDCNGSLVTFTNTSTADFGFIYNFGDGTTSTDENPSHTYDVPGTYTVTLDLIYDQDCIESFFQQVTTVETVVEADFSFSLGDCLETGATIEFVDNSTNNSGDPLSYSWSFTGATPSTSTDENPSVTVPTSGMVTASLTVTTVDDCSSTKDTTFTVNLALGNLSEEIIICPGDSAALNPDGDPALTYNWAPSPDFNADEVNPTTAVPGTYLVTITDPTAELSCVTVDTVTVIQPDDIGLEINGPNGPLVGGGIIDLPTLTFCGVADDISVDISTTDDVQVTFTDLGGNILGTGTTLTVNPAINDTIVVTATNMFGCFERDTVVLLNQAVMVEVDAEGGQIILCEPGDTSVTINNLNADDVLTYAWTANPIITSVLNQATVNVTTTTAGVETLSVLVTNQFGCDTTIQVEVITLEEIVLEISGPNGVLTDGGLELPTLAFCGEPAELSVEIISGSNVDVSYLDLNGNVLGTGSSITLNPMGSDTIIVVADGELGCGTRDTIVIDNQSISVEVDAEGGQIILCEPGDTSITVSNLNPDDVLTYAWTANPIITGALDAATVNITTTTAGVETLSVLVANQFGCDTTIQVEVITLEEIVLEISGPNGVLTDGGLELPTLAFCGEPAELSVEIVSGSNVDVFYTDLNGNVLGTGSSITLNPMGSDTIIVVANGELGCGTRDTIVINNEAVSVEIDAEGGRVILCEPGDTSVTITNLISDDVLTYVWEPNAIITGALNEATVNITTTAPGTETLSVLVTNQFGCDTTIQVEVITLEGIVLEITGPNGPLPDGGLELPTLSFCGEPAEVTVDIMAGGAVDITYTDLDGNVLGMGNTLTLNPSGRDTIVIIAGGELDCGLSDTIVVENNPISVDIDIEGDEIILCEPGDTSVTINNLNAGDTLTYVWTDNPIITGPLNGPSVDITTTEPGSEVLSVLVTNQFGCDTTVNVTVTTLEPIGLVVNGPDGPITGDSLTTCGEPVDLTAELRVEDGITVTFTDPSGNVLGMGSSLTVDPELQDTVIITAENEFGCTEMDTVIIINQQVNAELTVEGMDLSLCESSDTLVGVVNLDPRDELTYQWAENDIINGPLDGPTVSITTPEEGSTELSVLVTNQFGCDTTLTLTVATIPFMPNQYTSPYQACFGDLVTIEGGPRVEGYVYEWSPADGLDLSDPANPMGVFTEDVTLTVVITDPVTGCSLEQVIEVMVTPEISLMASPADTTLCAPGSVDVTASSVNEAVIYTWYSDEALTDSIASGPDFTIEGGVPGETYVVYVRGVDPNTNCEQSIPVTVRVSELTAGFPDEVVAACAGEPTSIFTENSPIATLQYTYEPAGIIDDSDPANPTFTGDDSTVVTVTVTDPVTGCSETLQVTINVTNLFTLTGVANPPEIFTGQSSELSIEGCENCTYVWFPPTGTVEPDTGRVVTATPDEAGEWIYEVEVTSNGCTEIVEVLLIVEDPICDTDRIFIPNAFTPNGDNRNDVLRVRSKFAEEITEFTFIIYNRWGQEVYKSDDIFDGWDGTAAGDDLEPDVYGYWLRVRCPFGEELIQQGNVTLMR
nr:gliding motility-associated C-terminal domain-containing protein [Lewinella sp. W8]